ncbi:selenocysteine-specific translation elongation factor [Phorcysia thermohydrogeniphila]|uniref:Selenocysteine-specific elongation factor n=1 Tax=Phorcysia thermohydrogeniphila TaxID=936138 RepID=A0A4R1GHY6_9BACT|nr:selenocysteine-specific translation elongation factor [Phorcysia thermohydrogeniphila]TCK06713.1 selenocysteine-specific translation elongation factor SelB [Phorcysia thermohydrogeniphila]
MQSKKFLVVGTAGHIDHGKTTLIKALTGIDTDRWEEEKRRGMTIDLGFAHLELPSGVLVGIVDVPGHEKFIKNMLAGAHGIDFVLFVIAADEGVMPQTQEHLTVCEVLGTKKGIVVLTKKDLVDDDWLELVKEDVKEFLEGTFLEGAPIIPVSSKTGEGLKELLEEMDKLAAEVEPKSSKGILRLPVDRSFMVKGFGTVVTGTLLSGKVKTGDTVEILPEGRRVKVRGLQVHGKGVDEAFAGQRTALNLSDVSKEEVGRGDLIATSGYLKPSTMVDVELTLSKDADLILQSGHKVHFHHLTKEVEGEVYLVDRDELLPGETALAQVRLKGEVVPVYGDRFVIRNYSPARVIGGGKVLNPLPERRFRRRFREEYLSFLSTLREKDKKDIVLSYVKKFPGALSPEKFVQLLNLTPEEASQVVKELVEEGELLLSGGELYPSEFFTDLKEKLLKAIETYHKEYPIAEGINKESLKSKLSVPSPILSEAIRELLSEGKIEESGGILRIKGFVPCEKGTYFEIPVRKAQELIEKKGFSPPETKEIAEELGISEEEANLIVSYLVNRKGYRKIADFIYSPSAIEKVKEILREHFKKKGTLSVGEFKDYLGVSRKFAIPLLEFFDSVGVTVRQGNERVKGEL